MTTVANGVFPIAVAVNAKTNRIDVANIFNHTISVIDGATNMVVTPSRSRMA